jgi:hypothetical protein
MIPVYCGHVTLPNDRAPRPPAAQPAPRMIRRQPARKADPIDDILCNVLAGSSLRDAREWDEMRRGHLLPLQTSQKQQSGCPENIVNIETDLSAGSQRISKGYLIDRVAQRWLELGWERGCRECFFGNTPAKTATWLVEAGISSLPVELGRLMWRSGGEGFLSCRTWRLGVSAGMLAARSNGVARRVRLGGTESAVDQGT